MDRTGLVLFAGAVVIVIAGVIAVFSVLVWRAMRATAPRETESPLNQLELDRGHLQRIAADD